MTRRWNSIVRKTAPYLSAGLLLQAGGCQINPAQIAQGLLGEVLDVLITGLVYGAFNLSTPGGFF